MAEYSRGQVLGPGYVAEGTFSIESVTISRSFAWVELAPDPGLCPEGFESPYKVDESDDGRMLKLLMATKLAGRSIEAPVFSTELESSDGAVVACNLTSFTLR